MPRLQDTLGLQLARAVLDWCRGTGKVCINDLHDLARVFIEETQARGRCESQPNGIDPILVLLFSLGFLLAGYAIGVEHATRLFTGGR